MMNLRKAIADRLVKLALRIDPKSEKVLEFLLCSHRDMLIDGMSITRIEPKDFYNDEYKEHQRIENMKSKYMGLCRTMEERKLTKRKRVIR